MRDSKYAQIFISQISPFHLINISQACKVRSIRSLSLQQSLKTLPSFSIKGTGLGWPSEASSISAQSSAHHRARTTPAVPADQHPALPAVCCPVFSLGRGRPCSPKAAPGDTREGRSPLISRLSLSGCVVKERAGGFTTWTLFLCRAPSASCGLTRLYCPRVDTWRRNWR